MPEPCDRYAARLTHRASEDWVKWQLCRFAEIALEIMCYGLCRAVNPTPQPENLFTEGMPVTFGVVREHALKLASARQKLQNAWGSKFFARVLTDASAMQALEAVNAERNNLAHGRKSLSAGLIEELVCQSLQLAAWAEIPKTDGDISLAEWLPWVIASSAPTRQTGLFERWQKNAIRYLVPETGEVFKVARSIR